MALKLGFEGIITELILGLHPANVSLRYKVTMSVIGWVQT